MRTSVCARSSDAVVGPRWSVAGVGQTREVHRVVDGRERVEAPLRVGEDCQCPAWRTWPSHRRSEELRTPPAAQERSSRRSEEHTSELQSRQYLVCRLLLEQKQHHATTSI